MKIKEREISLKIKFLFLKEQPNQSTEYMWELQCEGIWGQRYGNDPLS